MEIKSLLDRYPSLVLAYTQVRDVLSEQEQTASSLDGKAATLFAMATAIFGIGMPLILSFLNIHGIVKISDFSQAVLIGLIAAILIGCVLLSWIVIVRRSISAYGLRSFITMNNPEEIRLQMWHIEQMEFYHEILLNIEDAFYKNDKKLKQKATLVSEVMNWVIIEVVSLFALLFFSVLLKAVGIA